MNWFVQDTQYEAIEICDGSAHVDDLAAEWSTSRGFGSKPAVLTAERNAARVERVVKSSGN